MEWWRWVAAGVEAVLLVVLVLLIFDVLRDRPGWDRSRAARIATLAAIAIPIGFLLVLLLPLWIGLILIAVPALAVATMAMAS